jgi:hypothetical protein
MKLLSTTALPLYGSLQTDEPRVYYRSLVNESYIVISFSDTTVHVLSSRTGALLQERPLEQPSMVGGLVLDGDNLILTRAEDPSLTVYNIPTE